MNNKNEEAKASKTNVISKKKSIALLILLSVLTLSLIACICIRQDSCQTEEAANADVNSSEVNIELISDDENLPGEVISPEDEHGNSEAVESDKSTSIEIDTPLIDLELN